LTAQLPLQTIKLLVRKGSPVDVPNKKGWTPLHRAVYNGRRQSVQTLVELGASLTAVTKDGNSPLHLACFMNQLSTMEKLCELNASQKAVNLRGQKPIDLCISDGAREVGCCMWGGALRCTARALCWC
jgi:ankyrin repeat protein